MPNSKSRRRAAKSKEPSRPRLKISQVPRTPDLGDVRRVYRFLKKKDAEDFVFRGRVWVGTLYDFRSSEHGRGVRDKHEGISTTTAVFAGIAAQDNDLGLQVEKMGINVAGGEAKFGDGSIVKMNRRSSDMKILCFSKQNSSIVARQFEGKDSCVEVFDIDRLLTKISSKLGSRFKLVGLASITYVGNDVDLDSYEFDLNPAVLKSEEYSGQNEVRAIWTPTTPGNITPGLVKCGSLEDCCRLADIEI